MAKQRYKQSGKRLQKQQATKLAFSIDKMDNLGQGVSKQDGKVSFIAKTLPGESGSARIFRQRKGVSFAQVDRLDVSADNRLAPSCPHFNECPACDYLHTDYESELSYKEMALADFFRNLTLPASGIEVIPAPQRSHYRNRLQLHYRHKYIGMVDGLTDQIVEVPQCQVIEPALQQALDGLYQDKSWSQEHSGGGHVEIYHRDGEVSVLWDQPYAHGGFTQVYGAMNDKLCEVVTDYLTQQPVDSLLDLFSGAGNLTNAISEQRPDMKRWMVDYSEDVTHENFMHLDLFADESLRRFQRQTKSKQFDLFVVDPPRKGFVLLPEWVQRFKPAKMAYISCNAATLARDLHNLTKQGIQWQLDSVLLMDLFPGTFHFETVVFVSFHY